MLLSTLAQISCGMGRIHHTFGSEGDGGFVQQLQLLAERGDLQPENVIVAHEHEQILGAIVWLMHPGRSIEIWPPRTVTTEKRLAIEDALITEAVRVASAMKPKWIQSLLSNGEQHLRPLYVRCGMPRITALLRLRLEISSATFIPDCRQLPIRLVPYPQCDRDVFHSTWMSTHENSHDVPELNGLKSIEEIVATQRTLGVDNENLWYLALCADKPAGVAILCANDTTAPWELAYFGIVPRVRRSGIGRAVMLAAIDIAIRHFAQELHVTVDARNEPALKLYHQLGFVQFDSEDAHLLVFRE